MCQSNYVHKEGGKVSSRERDREEVSRGVMEPKRKERKRYLKIRATEKKERKIKTHILREQAESSKMGREKERSQNKESKKKSEAPEAQKDQSQRTRIQTKIYLGILESH